MPKILQLYIAVVSSCIFFRGQFYVRGLCNATWGIWCSPIGYCFLYPNKELHTRATQAFALSVLEFRFCHFVTYPRFVLPLWLLEKLRCDFVASRCSCMLFFVRVSIVSSEGFFLLYRVGKGCKYCKLNLRVVVYPSEASAIG